jgi:hypothetical protein
MIGTYFEEYETRTPFARDGVRVKNDRFLFDLSTDERNRPTSKISNPIFSIACRKNLVDGKVRWCLARVELRARL